MANKGENRAPGAGDTRAALLPRLAPLGEVRSRKMFSGFGLFLDGKMFGLINSNGQLFLKVGESNRARYSEAKSSRHGKMPYYGVPTEVFEDDEKLAEWARLSIAVAHA